MPAEAGGTVAAAPTAGADPAAALSSLATPVPVTTPDPGTTTGMSPGPSGAPAAPGSAAAPAAGTAPASSTAPQAPASATAPVAATSPAPSGAAAPATSAAWPSLPEQLLPRMAALRRLGDGSHRFVVRVDPESLGPVRVVADVTGGAVRVQLHAASDAAREALRQALPDLRRDLAAGGGNPVGTSIDVGTGSGGSAAWGGSGGSSTARQAQDLVRAWGGEPTGRPGTAAHGLDVPRRLPAAVPGRLDLLA